MTNEASLRQYASAITRAQAMAFRLGIQPETKTLTGILAALSKEKRRGFDWRYRANTRIGYASLLLPGPYRVGAQPSRRRTIQELLEWQTQNRRTRKNTLPQYATLQAVIKAALIGRTDHCTHYHLFANKQTNVESVVAATRQGKAIRFIGKRFTHWWTGRRGDILIKADEAPDFIMARDLWAAIPPLPPGWRLLADENGPFVLDVETNQHFHPMPYHWGHLVEMRSWSRIIEDAQHVFATRRRVAEEVKTSLRGARLITLIARFAPNLPVTLEDSECAGNCVAGTLAWARRHGIRKSGASAARIAELAKHDSRAGAVLIAAYRRARTERRMRFTAGGQSAPAAPIPG